MGETAIYASLRYLCAAIDHGEWHPGIGDPTVMGWTITIAYFVAVALCAVATRRAMRGAESPTEGSSPTFFWGGLTVLFLLLGINKQLDLQTWLWLTGRAMAHEEGWYGERKGVQVVFIAGVAIVGLLMLLIFFWLSRKAVLHHMLGLTGAVFVTSFVVIRAASFHHVDVLLGMRLGGIKMSAILELPGILCVIASASYTLITRLHRAKQSRPWLTDEELEAWRKRERPHRER